MSYDTRFLEPEERNELDELPNLQRGAPRVWESRLGALVGNTKWVPLMEGRKGVLRATRSNFRSGRISKPKGQVFECEVVTLDHQEENMATLFFRWMGPEKVLTEEEKEEAAHQKVLAKLAELEKENTSHVVGDPHGDREPVSGGVGDDAGLPASDPLLDSGSVLLPGTPVPDADDDPVAEDQGTGLDDPFETVASEAEVKPPVIDGLEDLL